MRFRFTASGSSRIPMGRLPDHASRLECAGAHDLTAWKQAMPFYVTDTGILRPFVLSDLCSHPRHERLAGKQLMRFPGTELIGSVHRFPARGAVARSAPLVRLAGRCATPQLISNRSRRAFQLSGNGPVGQPLPFQRLNGPSFFSLKVLPALALRQSCVIMMAVHSDCPLDECCLQTPFYHAGISLWIFSLSVQFHFTINHLFLVERSHNSHTGGSGGNTVLTLVFAVTDQKLAAADGV